MNEARSRLPYGLMLVAAAMGVLAARPRADEITIGAAVPVESGLSGISRESLAVGDIDGDLDLDLVMARRGDDRVSWFENVNGDGSVWQTHDIDFTVRPWSVDVGDVDGDDRLDVFIQKEGVGSGPTTYWLTQPGGGAVFTVAYPVDITPAAGASATVAVADLDGDLDPDVAVTAQEYFTLLGFQMTLRWKENRISDGLLVWQDHCVFVPFQCGLGLGAPTDFSDWVTVADVTGDGAADIVWTVTDSQFVTHNTFLFVNDGTGAGWNPVLLDAVALTPGGGGDYWRALPGDLDGDGLTDVLMAGGGNLGPYQIRWLRQDPAGNFSAAGLVANGPQVLVDAHLADVDDDGDLDALSMTTGFGSTLTWHENVDGSGTAWVPRQIPQGPATDAAPLDVDGDGLVDTAILANPSLVVRPTTLTPPALATVGPALAGTHGEPTLSGAGCLASGTTFSLAVEDALESAPFAFVIGFSLANAPLFGGTLIPFPDRILFGFSTDAQGGWAQAVPWPPGLPAGVDLWIQAWINDPAGPEGYAATNAVTGTTM